MTKLAAVTATLATVACAGAPAYTFTYTPTPQPLTYEVSERSVVLVETPQGNQRSADSSHARLDVSVGTATAGGHEVTVTFQSLDFVSTDISGTRRVNGGDLLGKPFRGTLTSAGEILIEDAPPIPTQLAGRYDLLAWLRDKMVPLPPTTEAQTWAVTQSITAQAQFRMELDFTGTAKFAGDTTWNGRPARVIAVEGQLVVDGSGSPPGAPGEIVLTAKGPSTRRYVWDAAEGIMLAASTDANLSGDVSVLAMGVSLPTTFTGSGAVRLVN